MKKITAIGFLIVLGLVLCSMDSTSERILKGRVIDQDGKPLIVANINVVGAFLGTTTDFDGYFSLNIPEGKVSIMVSYTGYKTKKVIIEDELDITVVLEPGGILEEVIVVCGSSAGKVNESKKSFWKKDDSRITSMMEESMIEAPRTTTPPSPVSDIYSLDIGFSSEDRSYKSPGEKNPISHGTLTAGEWNDLNNWEDWKSLLENKDFQDMEEYWNFKMTERYSVFVTNKYELPIVDCSVRLKDSDNNIVWEAKTDNSGKAELWNNIFLKEKASRNLEIEIFYNKRSYQIHNAKNFEEGVNHYQIEEECNTPSNVDIMFVVDATGSMGDEINYLKKELEDVISRSKSVDRDLNFRMGSVFYRDKGDDYVANVSPLSSDITQSLKFVKNNDAAGGGDYPEAVHIGLEEALLQDWNQSAITRIMFLLLDAPPHHEPEIMSEIQDHVEEAARLGIKIIPITASGINRQTEFLMKFFSISTNGTYVFLTDDSGIGEKHLTPVVSDFEIEKLNDLMVRLISNFSKAKGCEDQSQNTQWVMDAKIYPNPTSNFVNIDLEKDIDRLYLRSASGKVVYSASSLPPGITKIDLENMVDGVYSIQLVKGGQSMTKQLILIN